MERTPQTHVAPLVVIRRRRALPLAGTISARLNQKVQAGDLLGRCTLTPSHSLIDVAHALGLPVARADEQLKRKAGEVVSGGDILAGPVGLMRRVVRAPSAGRIVLEGDGRLLFEAMGEVFELRATYPGVIVGMEAERSVTIETVGAQVEGVWGNGHEEFGLLRVGTASPADELTPANLEIGLRSSVIVAGRVAQAETLRALAGLPVRGLIAGGLPSALIPVAEEMAYPVMLTEGFGNRAMNTAAFELLASNAGREASLNAQPSIRWQGIRPEVIVPLPSVGSADVPSEGVLPVPGRQVRIVREPHPGKVGTIVSLPADPIELPSGLHAWCAEIELPEGGIVLAPLANLDILE
jgi:hypothetical protein